MEYIFYKIEKFLSKQKTNTILYQAYQMCLSQRSLPSGIDRLGIAGTDD